MDDILNSVSNPRDIVIFAAGILFAIRELRQYFIEMKQRNNGGTHEDKLLKALADVSKEVRQNREVVSGKLDTMSKDSAQQFHAVERLIEKHELALSILNASTTASNRIMESMVTWVKELGSQRGNSGK